MADVHLVVGVSLIALNLLAAAWGGIAWLRDRASIAFWYVLRSAQVSVFVQVMLGSLLVGAGPPGPLGLLYGNGGLPRPRPRPPKPPPPGATGRGLGVLGFGPRTS